MKTFKLFSLLFVLMGVVTLMACTELNASEDVYVTLDINPSIELIVTPREKVIYANALNEDGEVLLATLDLIGMDLDDAIDLIIEEALFQGFIDVESEEIDISVETVSKGEAIRERIHQRVKENVDEAFERRAMIGRAIDKEFQQELIDEAEEKGVTPGFLRLVKSVLLQNDTYTEEELLQMAQDELIALLKEAQEAHRVLMHSVRETFLAEKEALHAYYNPLLEDLYAQLEEEGADVEAIQAQIDALEAEKQAEFQALRSEFVEQTQLLAQQMRMIHNQNRENHRMRVQQFLDEAEQRREQIQERIDEFQENSRRPE